METLLPSHGLAWRYVRWWASGSALVGLFLALAWISPRFAYGGAPLERPVLLLVMIGVAAGALYLWVVVGIEDAPRSRALLMWVIAVGAVIRIIMALSPSMLEDDFYRYLWDGAVVAEGINPYVYSPEIVREAQEESVTVPSALILFAEESGVVISRINHAHLRTIYPPVAQGAFALAHWLSPWSLSAWRCVLFLFDFSTLFLLLMVMRALGLPSLLVAVYWWNPILVRETYNAAHMDIVALPFVVGAVLLSVRGRHMSSMVSLALATGAKLWPVVLLPLLLRPLLTKPKRLIPALGIFGILCGAMAVPVYVGGFDGGGGFTAYGRYWEMNDALFMLVLWGVNFVSNAAGILAGHGKLAARIVILLLLAIWIAWLARREANNGADLCERCLLAVAAVFLLSPTQFPWYYIWLVPFLAMQPRTSLLLLTALLPLYYLRFYFLARDRLDIFDYGIVWLEFAPVWLLLIWEWIRARRGRPPRSLETPA